ncbi:MAG: dipeptidase [Bacillota bacterium]
MEAIQAGKGIKRQGWRAMIENINARKFHRQMAVVDAHCDVLWRLLEKKATLAASGPQIQISLEKLLEGGISLIFCAVYVEPEYLYKGALRRAMQIIDVFYKEMETNKKYIRPIQKKGDIDVVLASGKIGAVLSLEGGDALEGDLGVLRLFYRLGIRCAGLTWNHRNQLADGMGEGRKAGGLSRFGCEVVQEMNHLGMIVDVSHLSERGFWDVLEITKYPVIASHSNCWSLCHHNRNLRDSQIRALAEKSGVIGITFVPAFVAKKKANLDRVLDQIEHVCQFVGTEHVAIGSDFEGVEHTVEGLEDVSTVWRITEGLLARGYSDIDTALIMGGNWLRVMREVWR